MKEIRQPASYDDSCGATPQEAGTPHSAGRSQEGRHGFDRLSTRKGSEAKTQGTQEDRQALASRFLAWFYSEGEHEDQGAAELALGCVLTIIGFGFPQQLAERRDIRTLLQQWPDLVLKKTD